MSEVEYFTKSKSSVEDRRLKQNTKVLWRTDDLYGPDKWYIGYVAEVNSRDEWDHELVVASTPNQKHGNFAKEWFVLGKYEEPVETDKYGLTEGKKIKLAKDALDSAKKHGYCDESKKVLEDLGLPTKFPKKVKKSVYVEVLDDEDADEKLKSLGLEVVTFPDFD